MKNRIPLSTLFNNPVDETIDSILSGLIDRCEIESIKYPNDYYMDIVFTKDERKIIFHALNTCKWCNWLSRGYIKMINDTEIKELYRWDDCRPGRKTMNKLLNKLSKYYNKTLYL